MLPVQVWCFLHLYLALVQHVAELAVLALHLRLQERGVTRLAVLLQKIRELLLLRGNGDFLVGLLGAATFGVFDGPPERVALGLYYFRRLYGALTRARRLVRRGVVLEVF